MDTRCNLHIAPRDNAEGAVPELEADGMITLFFVGVVVVCFAAPLLMSLPQMLDAAASPAPLIRETMDQAALQAAAGGAPGPTFNERHPVMVPGPWIDMHGESALATWRLRSSD